ncbi:MAG TPA: hypothetical protein VMF06_08155 [Candidatus Limnocylindria bacterium]|jgi:hypothetical protein|nr:hypothetical protein [Candidatus Limnocylindria bacterium]
MLRSSHYSTWAGWLGICSVAACLHVAAGDKVVVSSPKKSTSDNLPETPEKEESKKSREGFFDFLRKKPSSVVPGDSLGGAVAPPLSIGTALDPATQKRLLDEFQKRQNWLQEGANAASRPANPAEGIMGSTNSSEMFLTPAQRDRLAYSAPYTTGKLEDGIRRAKSGNSVNAAELQDRGFSLESIFAGSGDPLNRDLNRDGSSSKSANESYFGFSADQPGEKSMLEFYSNRSRSDSSQNGFLPGFANSIEQPSSTMLGNRLLTEPKTLVNTPSPFGSALQANPLANSPAFGSGAFDSGSKGPNTFGNSFGGGDSSPLNSAFVPPRSAFSAPDPIISRPVPVAPSFNPRPVNLPIPRNGL